MKFAAAGIWVLALSSGAAAQDDKVLDAALTKFRADYDPRARDDDGRIAAITALARHPHDRVLKALASLMTRGTVPVRIASARALGAFGGVEGTEDALVGALVDRHNASQKQRPVRVMILRSLGDLRARDAVSQVDKLIEDKDVWIAKAAIDAAGKIRSKTSIDALLDALKRIEGPRGETELMTDPLGGAIAPASWVKLIVDEANSKGPAKTERDLLRDPIHAALRSISRTERYAWKDWSEWWTRNKRAFKVQE